MELNRILIVEDDPLISTHLETIVLQTVSSDVVVTRTAAEAWTALATDIDFALLDVDVLDGKTYSFATKLSSSSIPFAFVSGSNRREMPAALRFAPFVAKPYCEDDIVALLRAAETGTPSNWA